MFRIRKLEVRKFRGLAAPVTLEFGDRYHLIIGDNGAGKTNLLKLLAMITRLDFSSLKDESFDFSWVGEAEGEEVQGAFRSERDPDGSEVQTWSWKLGATDGAELTGTGRPADDGADPSRLFWQKARFRMVGTKWGGRRTTRADEALGCFGALTTAPTLTSIDVPNFSIHTIREEEVARPFPTAERLSPEWTAKAVTGEADPIPDDWLPWLLAARHDLAAQSIRLRPRLREVGEITTYVGCDLTIRFSPHLAVHHDRLSFGQKRLIGLRYYLATAPESPAIIDELSNGLHHTWVESIVRDLEPRQSFLATQNPLLMDTVWWDSAEEAGRGIILCTRDAEHRWVWRQLSPEEATRFYDAWRAGIQQIHEVLKTEGWW